MVLGNDSLPFHLQRYEHELMDRQAARKLKDGREKFSEGNEIVWLDSEWNIIVKIGKTEQNM